VRELDRLYARLVELYIPGLFSMAAVGVDVVVDVVVGLFL